MGVGGPVVLRRCNCRSSEAALVNATFSVTPADVAGGRFVRFPDGINGSTLRLSGLPLEAGAAIDVQVTDYAINPRAYDPSSATVCRRVAVNGSLTGSAQECQSGVASSLQTCTLRQGSEELNVSNLATPVQLGFTYTLPAAVNRSRACDANVTDRCIARHDALLEQVRDCPHLPLSPVDTVLEYVTQCS